MFFLRHNGGSVWLDELSPPWPRHWCMDGRESGPYLTRLDGVYRDRFGLVVWVKVEPKGRYRLGVRWSDGNEEQELIPAQAELEEYLGALVVVYQDEDDIYRLGRLDG